MVLEDLVDVIEKIRERIRKYEEELSKNEALTRNALVEPVLKVLNWDPEDPELVIPEYKIGKEKYSADYVLKKDNESQILIEVKRLNENLLKYASQAISYCNMEGIPYLVLTDGRKWLLYDVFSRKPLEKKCLMKVDVLKDSIGDIVFNLLTIWNPPDSLSKRTPPRNIVLLRSGKVVPEEGISLKDIDPKELKNVEPPLELVFPDGSRAEVNYWNELLKRLVKWLYDNKYIEKKDCPITTPGKQRYVIHTKPEHEKLGKRFVNPYKIDKELYLELNWDKIAIIRICQYLIKEYAGNKEFYIVTK